MSKTLLGLALIVLPSAAMADSRLLYLEAQAVAGYSSGADDIRYCSAGSDDAGSFVSVEFALPSGAYATIVLREIMKNDSAAAATAAPEAVEAPEEEEIAED